MITEKTKMYWKELELKHVQEELLIYFNDGNLEYIDYLYSNNLKNTPSIWENLNTCYLALCEKDHFHLLNFLFISKLLHRIEPLSLYQGFSIACNNGNVDTINCLLNLFDHKEFSNTKNTLYYDLNQILKKVCYYNQVETAKLLLTHELTKEFIDIHKDELYIIKDIVDNGYVELAKLLLTSSEIKENANLHISPHHLFYNYGVINNIKFIEFLIFEYNIERTKLVDNVLKEKNRDDILKLFDKRDLFNSLDQKLSLNKNNVNKNKL